MLHPIKLSDYNQCLEKIAQFQEQFMAFLCDPNTPLTPNKDDFKHTFGEEIGEWFYQWLQKKSKSHRGVTYYSSLCDILIFFGNKPPLRLAILDAFHND